MARREHELFTRVEKLTHLGPGELARRLGVSVRTVQRWRLGTGDVFTSHLQTLAELVAGQDPKLATTIYDHVDDNHRRLGLELPKRPDRNAVRNEPGSRLADGIIATAAEMVGVSHAKMRPALRAALLAAKQGGATLDSLIRGLERSDPG